jgi:hypothetical protein
MGNVELGGAFVEGVDDDHRGAHDVRAVVRLAKGAHEQRSAEPLTLVESRDGQPPKERRADLRVAWHVLAGLVRHGARRKTTGA